MLITSFKTPPAVNGGPTYLPFIDLAPTLDAWADLFSGRRGRFFNTFFISTLVTLFSSLVATAIAFGGHQTLTQGFGLGRFNAAVWAFPSALAAAILVNRLRLPEPVLGNADILFWFVSQRLFPPSSRRSRCF